MIAIDANKKPGISEYKLSQLKLIQSKTVIAPVIIPANAPLRVIRAQNTENTTIGPNAAPKPAQAWLTKSSTLLLGLIANKIAITETNSTIIRPTQTNSRCLALGRIKAR